MAEEYIHPEGTMKQRRKCWREEFEVVQNMGLPGTLEWSMNDYEAFRYKEENVLLIFYPHQTTAGHHHLRLREQHSKDAKRAHEIMMQLDCSINSCTFSRGFRTRAAMARLFPKPLKKRKTK